MTVCSIGTSEPWNAAGLGLDVRAIAACGAHAVTVVAGVTAQDRDGIHARHAIPAAVVVAQLAALSEADIAAYRLGALLDVGSVEAVAAHLARAWQPVVYDPVLAASGGGTFADDDVVRAIRARLVPLARLLTPNLDEAGRLTADAAPATVEEMESAGRRLRDAGAAAVLVKGGHLRGKAIDVLVDGDATTVFEGERLPGTLRGTGCLLACAVAARLGAGDALVPAIEFGRAFVRRAFDTARTAGGMRLAY